MSLSTYDALLLVSFGGPEGPDEVLPFLRVVTRGREIPDDRLLLVGEHYLHFGGVSPINAQCRSLVAALGAELAARGVDLPVYWGNRNWHPLLADTLARMRDDGVRHALAVVTSAYSSYSGCRQYREDLASARARVGEGAPEIDKLRQYFDLPGFVAANIDAVRAAYDRLPDTARDRARLVFTTHSIPVAAAAASGPDGGAYVAQHEQVARLVAEGVGATLGETPAWDLVYQSRSGPPGQPWLEPDVNDHLAKLAAGDVTAVVLAPIGFVSDHMEVLFDLDVEVVATAARLGLTLQRAATAGTAASFVAGLVDRVLARDAAEAGGAAEVPAVGDLPPAPDVCPARCCANPRGPRPTVAGS